MKFFVSVVFSLVLTIPSLASAKTLDYQAKYGLYQFALFHLGGKPFLSKAEAETTIAQVLPKAKVVSKFSKKPQTSEIYLDLIDKDLQKKYRPQSLADLKYFGRGLTQSQTQQLQNSKKALVITFVAPSQTIFKNYKKSLELMANFATKCDCVIWDEDTRETYSLRAWQERRLKGWQGELPLVRNHTIIHFYRTGDKGLARLITLGMKKFGLPDLAINNATVSSGKNMGNLINVLTQLMAEKKPISSKGEMVVDLKSIKHTPYRKDLLASLKSNKQKTVPIKLSALKPEKGDPDNLILEVKFDNMKGKGLHEKHDAMVSALFGSEDKISMVKHNEAIYAARTRARKKLPALRKLFREDFKSIGGGYLLLKGPLKPQKAAMNGCGLK